MRTKSSALFLWGSIAQVSPQSYRYSLGNSWKLDKVLPQKDVTIWIGIEVVDTPGIHTAKRPDHDAITYRAIAEADLIIFVCTAEGFSQNLGEHFRKLLVEKGKGNEMMLVFNKMEDSLYGNTVEGQQEFFERDVKPVISPEYTAEDL